MKKFPTLLSACALAAALTSAVYAQSTDFTFEYSPDPDYTIVIPASLALQQGENVVTLAVTEANNFNCGRLSVTLTQTVPNGNFLALSRLDEKGWWTGDMMPYDIITAEGEEILYNRDGSWDQYIGKELASFTEAGEKSYLLIPDPQSSNQPGAYGGTVEYTVEFIPA